MDQAMTMYHWEDDEAPMTGGDDPERQRVELLHRVLVDGYGSKQSAGWEEISTSKDEDGYLQHFTARQPFGNGLYVRVERGKDIVAARDVENEGLDEEDLVDKLRAGLDPDGHRPPEHERWIALAGERSFLLCYALTETGEPYTGDDSEPASILEGFIDFDDMMAHTDSGAGYLVGGASGRTQFFARYGAHAATEDATDCSAAIEGYPDRWLPHYAALIAPLGYQDVEGDDAARETRLSQANLIENRVIADQVLIRDGNHTVRGYVPNLRFLLTGFGADVDDYSPDDWPKLGDKVVVDDRVYRFAFAGGNGSAFDGAPNLSLLLFREGS